ACRLITKPRRVRTESFAVGVSRRIERDRRLKHDINIAVLRTNGNKGLALTFHVAKEHSIYICGTLVDASYTSVLTHVLARIWMQALEAAVVMCEITDRMFHGFLPPYVGGPMVRRSAASRASKLFRIRVSTRARLGGCNVVLGRLSIQWLSS